MVRLFERKTDPRKIMATPQLHRQLLEQLSQWIIPKDLRHLKNCAEIVAATLESESACAAHWIPYLSHRECHHRIVFTCWNI